MDVMDRAIGEVLAARPRARQVQPFVAARGPAMHHRGGDVGVKLDAERMAGAKGFHRKVASLGEQFTAGRQLESLAMPVIDVVRPVGADRPATEGDAE